MDVGHDARPHGVRFDHRVPQEIPGGRLDDVLCQHASVGVVEEPQPVGEPADVQRQDVGRRAVQRRVVAEREVAEPQPADLDRARRTLAP